MPILAVRPVDAQPRIALRHWRVMEADQQACHLIGQDMATGMARVSSAIVAMDASCTWATTISGRLYSLEGAPGEWVDADYVWALWAEFNSVRVSTDVTARFVWPNPPYRLTPTLMPR